MISNVQEVKARGGQVIGLVEGAWDDKLGDPECQFVLPEVSEWLAPVLFTVPLQLLAYHIAVPQGNGCGSAQEPGQERHGGIGKRICEQENHLDSRR